MKRLATTSAAVLAVLAVPPLIAQDLSVPVVPSAESDG